MTTITWTQKLEIIGAVCEITCEVPKHGFPCFVSIRTITIPSDKITKADIDSWAWVHRSTICRKAKQLFDAFSYVKIAAANLLDLPLWNVTIKRDHPTILEFLEEEHHHA